VPVEAVRAAVEAGELPALSFGGFVRISRDALLSRAAAPTAVRAVPVAAAVTRPQAPPQDGSGLPAPEGLAWVEELTEAEPFTIPWPKKGGGSQDEHYPRAWRGVVTLNGVRHVVRIGECVRHDRGRLTVLFGRDPITEFAATTDGLGWASVIKPDGKKVLTASEVPPPLYSHARIASYREMTGLSGIGVPKGLAVILRRDDLRGVVHHAAARWLGRNRFPVVPAV
jgi:hypothetical protein